MKQKLDYDTRRHIGNYMANTSVSYLRDNGNDVLDELEKTAVSSEDGVGKVVLKMQFELTLCGTVYDIVNKMQYEQKKVIKDQLDSLHGDSMQPELPFNE
jgi:hypothetical protein